MSKTKSILFFVLCYFVGYGQIQHGGSPISLSLGNLPQEVPMITAPPINIQALHEEDEVVDLIKDIPWRYGYIHYVNASLQDGVFEALPNGDRVWRLKINSVGAQTLNLTFDVYKLAPGAQLFIYNENYNDVLGSFTSENNKDHGFLTTTLIKGDLITVELYEPQAVVGLSALHLQRVVHGYRALDYQKKYIGDSGNCNNNVVCPEGDSWRDQIRSPEWCRAYFGPGRCKTASGPSVVLQYPHSLTTHRLFHSDPFQGCRVLACHSGRRSASRIPVESRGLRCTIGES